MTTIAFRAGIFAADTSQWLGDCYVGTKRKIEIVSNNIVAISGHRPDAECLVDWLKQNRNGNIARGPDGLEFSALIWSSALGLEYVVCHKGVVTVDTFNHDFAAIGSGRAVAMGAMAHGASAFDAVIAASKVDAWTRGGPEMIDCHRSEWKVR